MKSKMTDTRREAFYVELHALLTAGLDFSHAFALLIGCEANGEAKALFQRLYGNVVEGCALWQAMEGCGAFGQLDCGVVRLGEQTGQLAEALDFLRDYYHKRTEQRRMVSSAVSYPLVILLTAVVVVVFMLLVIVPMFEEVYARMGGELPVLTRCIIDFSKAFPRYAAVGAVGVSAAAGLLYCNRRNERVQARLSTLLLRMPVVGGIVRRNYQARFCKLLCLQISSGMPLLTGIGMLSEVIGFYPYRTSFGVICRALEQGESFAEGLMKFPTLYDRKLAALIRVGEETNCLSEMLRREAETLSQQLEYEIRRIGSMLEPVLIMLVGVLVAVILISMYMPMFRLGGIMG